MSANMIAGYHDFYWLPPGDSGPTDANDWIGATGPDGINVSETDNLQAITGDVLGPNTIVDHVSQGVNVTIEFTLQEVKLIACKRFMHPWQYASSDSVTGSAGLLPTPGILGSAMTGVLEAIPRSSTPAASLNASGGNGRRYYGICIGPRNFTLDTTARFVPIRFQCYPFSDSGVIKHHKWISAIGVTL